MEMEGLTVCNHSGPHIAHMLILTRQRVRPAHDAEVGGMRRDQAWRVLADTTILSCTAFSSSPLGRKACMANLKTNCSSDFDERCTFAGTYEASRPDSSR